MSATFIRSFALSLLALSLALNSGLAAPAADEGIALAIIYDTSGSMVEPVPARSGGTSPKYVIANRALEAIVNQIQKFTTNASAGKSRNLQAGLFTFANGGAAEAVKFGPFNP